MSYKITHYDDWQRVSCDEERMKVNNEKRRKSSCWGNNIYPWIGYYGTITLKNYFFMTGDYVADELWWMLEKMWEELWGIFVV